MSVEISRTASDNEPSVAATVMADDSRKRPARGHCTLAKDSDDEFEDLSCINVGKKRAKERLYVDSTSDGRSAAAGEIIRKSDVESSSKQDRTAVVTDVTSCTASLESRACSTESYSLAADCDCGQQKVAQRLSKFAFNESFLRQRQESFAGSSAARVKSCGLQSSQRSIGNLHSLFVFSAFYMKND